VDINIISKREEKERTRKEKRICKKEVIEGKGRKGRKQDRE